MTQAQWMDTLALGDETMDRTHREFVALVAALEEAADATLLPALDALIEHTATHFEREDRWMAESRFPMRDCHLAEHEGVLAVLHEARGHVAQARVRVARVLPPELMHWFEGHVASMDAMLARWMEAHPPAAAGAPPARGGAAPLQSNR